MRHRMLRAIALTFVLAGCPSTPHPDVIDSGSDVVDSGRDVIDGGSSTDAFEAGCGTADCGIVGCVTGQAGAYTGTAVDSSQTGSFEAQFDATPLTAGDTALGMATGTAGNRGWTDLATAVRFAPDGNIDAVNGAQGFARDASIAFTLGQTYRVREIVDVATHTYSVYVTPPGGSETRIAAGYAFRAEQSSVTSLDQWGTTGIDSTGSVNACLTGLCAGVPSQSCTITNGTGQQSRTCGAGSVWSSWSTCTVASCDAGFHQDGNTCVANAAGSGAYPFEGYTLTRGGFEAIRDGQPNPQVLIVDTLSGGVSGDEVTHRGTLRWALTRTYPRVILFEVSGTIDLAGAYIEMYSPYLSVYGQTAPSPGITVYGGELIIRTHNVIFQHLRLRQGDTLVDQGDVLDVAGDGTNVHDIILDHCSFQLGHDELVDLSSSYGSGGSVRAVTLSHNILSHALRKDSTVWHNYALIIESGDSNNMGIDEILVNGNLFSQVADRTPLINPAARHVTVTNNVAYNTQWNGPFINTAGYTEGLFIDYMNNLYWRGPRTESAGFWPRSEASTWPSQPSLWPTDWPDQPTANIHSVNGSSANTQIYYGANYQYVNNSSYSSGQHEGRPVSLENERFYDGLTAAAVQRTSRVTSVAVSLETPLQVEHGLATVGASQYRDALDSLAVDTAMARNGDWVQYERDLGVPVSPPGTSTRNPATIGGYPTGHELSDGDGDGYTDLENWIYGLYY